MREFAIRLLDTQFAGPLASDAEYVAAGGSPTGVANCRIMKRIDDGGMDFGGSFSTKPHTQNYAIEVRVAEVPGLKERDLIIPGLKTDGVFVPTGEVFRVAEPPVKPDSERLKWRAVCQVEGAPGG